MSNRVLVQFYNGIGNAVMFTPTLKALTELYNCEVDLICASIGNPVTEILTSVKNVRLKGFRKNMDYDTYNIFYSPRHGERTLAYFSIREYCKPKGKKLLGDKPVLWEIDKIHEIDYYMLDLWEEGYRKPIPNQIVPKYLKRKINGVFSKKRDIRIAFCNGYQKMPSPYGWWRKSWKYFQELGDLIECYYGNEVEILPIGGEDDRKWIKSLVFKNKVNYNRKLSIKDTVTLLLTCDCLVTTDTASMHIGDALDIPMIVLFGPTLVSKNGPKSKKAYIVKADMDCVPCQGTPNWTICRNPVCMESIEPSKVMDIIRSIINAKFRKANTN